MFGPLRQSLSPLVLAAVQASSGGGGGNSATYLGYDATTQGNWIGVYGADGYVIDDRTGTPDGPESALQTYRSIPSYASFGASTGINAYVWQAAGTTTDVRALKVPPSGTQRIASTWYDNTSETFDLTISGGVAKPVRMYFLDWDFAGRAVNVTVEDGSTSATLDGPRSVSSTSPVSSAYANGVYLGWSISGHVKITVVLTGTTNAVVSGFFFN